MAWLLPASVRAQASPPTEYQIKAAFLFNFAKYVEWPAATFPSETSPIVIGVLGENVFGDNLEQTLRNKTIQDHPLQFKAFHSVEDVKDCQILFVSPSEEGHFHKILDGLGGLSILTVGQSDDFIDSGGMINFVLEDNRIRFQINNTAARKARLKISSKLLSLAVSSR